MGYNVIGRAIEARVLTEAERNQAVRRCLEDPAYEQHLEDQIAAKGTATSAARGRSAGAAATPSGPAAEMLRAWTGGDSAYREILAAGIPMPELFPGGPAGGTLPHSTASGMDPQRLAAAPPWCRPAIREEPSLSEAEELLAAAVDDPSILEVSEGAFTRAAGYVDFRTGLEAVVMAATRVKVARDADAQIAAARQARVSASSAKSPMEMTDDELYEAAYGERDRRREQLRASQRRGGVEVRNWWDGGQRR